MADEHTTLSGPETPCERNYTYAILKQRLFQEKAGVAPEADEEKALDLHIRSGECRCCNRSVIELKASEPFLYDDNYELPKPHVDIIRRQGEGGFNRGNR